MASSSSSPPVTPDTPITIKVQHAGVTKKIKLPFRDLVADSLERQVRALPIFPFSTDND